MLKILNIKNPKQNMEATALNYWFYQDINNYWVLYFILDMKLFFGALTIAKANFTYRFHLIFLIVFPWKLLTFKKFLSNWLAKNQENQIVLRNLKWKIGVPWPFPLHFPIILSLLKTLLLVSWILNSMFVNVKTFFSFIFYQNNTVKAK